ncbi:AbrB/MazE/SpoVT family DNA-binding domain-containing protein [Sporosarcina koreensis]|uniref:AbrB/MazE/SpoVT family DNA-binding domain-containing protein n=1 Tax=Sporosarcina koreensis TaxID=334735 RepID=UPI000A438860|nr:AbrB/MazE/SpoVT family DNA-binding domain-containing protein [Sporosarcina koreensis]
METNKKEVLAMTTTAQKWGGSIGVRIPQRIAKKYGVVNGTQLEISDDGERIIIRPVENEFTLEELLAQCEGGNPHQEFFSEPAGREEI